MTRPLPLQPDTSLELEVVGDTPDRVGIAGRNLDARVVGGVTLTDRDMLRHRVTWVREVEPEAARTLPDSAVVVEQITVR